jgi:hypothetical protein
VLYLKFPAKSEGEILNPQKMGALTRFFGGMGTYEPSLQKNFPKSPSPDFFMPGVGA